jgi:hypothetical protein
MNNLNIKDSRINGPVVGRDYHYHAAVAPPDLLRKAIEKIESMDDGCGEYQEFIERLNFYLQARADRKVIGLEEKLIRGNRQEIIDDATFYKDNFAKIVAKGQLARKRQYVFFYALQKIHALFQSKIRPLINQDASAADIDEKIYTELIDCLFKEIHEFDISIDQTLIYGMLYYLTGMCHLIWEKK